MNVAIIGASGYTVLGLIKILINSNTKFNMANVIGEINAYASYVNLSFGMKNIKEYQK